MSTASAEGKPEDLDVILPPPGDTLTIAGIPCTIKRLKSRELLMVLRILTNTFSDLRELNIDLKDEDAMVTKFVGILVVAIPESIEESLALIQEIVEPKDKDGATRMKLRAELANPDPDVLLDVVETMIYQEKDDLREFVGKAQAMWKRVSAVYRPAGTPGPSPAPSTS